jgi:cytochrome c oxidase cbb3-type subunit 3
VQSRIGLVAVILGVAAGCGKGSAKPQPGAAPAARPAPVSHVTAAADPTKLEGAALYRTFCAPCHGADAKGYKSDNAPSLINPTFLQSASDEYLRRSIVFGRPGTAMGGYGKEVGGPLAADAVARLVRWLRAQGPTMTTLTAVAKGDAAHGATLYAQDCQKCHGDAKTRGEAVHLANSQFQAVATDSFLAYAIEHGRPGTKMEAWQGKLTTQDVADVIAHIRTLGRPKPIGMLPAPTGKEPLFAYPHGKAPSFTPRSDPCPPAAPGAPKCTPNQRYVPAAQVKAAIAAKRKFVIIDARPASEWRRVHVVGAVSIPYHDMKRLDEIPKDAYVIAYCACPHHLSGIVVDELRRRGYPHAYILDEGILDWQRRKFPVVAAPGVVAPPAEPPMPPGTIR